MIYKFHLLVYQNDTIDEELDLTQEFDTPDELVQALVAFAAQQSHLRLSRRVSMIYSESVPQLHLPPARQGYGPDTCVVVQSVEQAT